MYHTLTQSLFSTKKAPDTLASGNLLLISLMKYGDLPKFPSLTYHHRKMNLGPSSSFFLFLFQIFFRAI
jgi:hypothetical protein